MRDFLAEPAFADPPRRVWRDWALLGAIVVGAVAEAVFRPDVEWRVASLIVCLAISPLVLWRRTHPLATLVAAFVAANLLGVIGAAFGSEFVGLYTTAFVLVMPYTLLRWASGRHVAVGAAVMLAAWVVGVTFDPTTIGESIGGLLVLLTPALLGEVVRYRAITRRRQVDDVKTREREQIARELHDTVAHHVSAIAVQAQAGRALASTRPDAALAVLAVIEEAASRTLEEMRSMVGTLRNGHEAELAPQQRIRDLPQLADAFDRPQVCVELSGWLDDVPQPVDTAAFRIAQESVTNAVRHARRATRIDVVVTGEHDAVRLHISDDGDHVTHSSGAGYGLIGMHERAALLGGTLAAGPNARRGWSVIAELPRSGAR